MTRKEETEVYTKKEGSKQIVFFANGIYPFQTRGAEVGIYYLSRELVRREFEVTIFLSEFVTDTNTLDMLNLPSGMRIVRARGIPIRFLYNLTFPFGTLIDIIRRNGRPSVAAANVPTLLSLICAYTVHCIYRVPYFVIIHGPSDFARDRVPIRIIQCAFLRKASCLFCVSKDLKKMLRQTLGVVDGKIEVIPNGYDSAEVDLAIASTKGRSTSSELIFAGSLVPAKDPLALLASFEGVLSDRPDILLHVVGEGPLKLAMQQRVQAQRIQGSVFFHGILPHNKLLQLISESTMLVMASREEGLPTVAIEALALGKPVIATNVGGLADLLIDGKNGYLVPLGETGLFIKRILQVLDNADLRERLSAEAIKSVKGYEWDSIGEKYSSIIQSMLKG